jgi:hypothetical protein
MAPDANMFSTMVFEKSADLIANGALAKSLIQGDAARYASSMSLFIPPSIIRA